MLNFRNFEALTFDCYGTLIDWESGILAALRPFRDAHRLDADDEELLARYSRAETHAELRPYRRYKEVLRNTMRLIAESFGIKSGFNENLLVDSLPKWRPFPDTVASLAALKHRFRLGIISNIDDDLFAKTAEHLQVEFDWVVTAQQSGAYKPAQKMFRHALKVMDVPMQHVLHVAQSKYHDVGPLNQMEWDVVWINRRHSRSGSGATQHFDATPSLEVASLADLVRAVEHQLQRWDG